MGNYRNTIFLAKIGDLYKMKKEIIDKVCYQVIKAIQLSNL